LLCLSQAKTCMDLQRHMPCFFVFSELRLEDECVLYWYWNCSPSLFKLSFITKLLGFVNYYIVKLLGFVNYYIAKLLGFVNYYIVKLWGFVNYYIVKLLGFVNYYIVKLLGFVNYYIVTLTIISCFYFSHKCFRLALICKIKISICCHLFEIMLAIKSVLFKMYCNSCGIHWYALSLGGERFGGGAIKIFLSLYVRKFWRKCRGFWCFHFAYLSTILQNYIAYN
jgi:hypothetical protein